MDFVANAIGVSLPVSSARDAVMKPRRSHQRLQDRDGRCPAPSLRRHRDSLLCLNHMQQQQQRWRSAKDDDDTASTVSETYSDSFDTPTGSVSFAEPVVTHVYLRPATTQEEKRALFYADADYREFRREYYSGVVHRDPVVRFADDVVSDVKVFSCDVAKDKLYYSESDLQRFLDEFVSSLS